MKAYQLKIAIKNSKPLVWKRCRVPAGITFSQLAPILEVVTETAENAWYEFEFSRKRCRLENGREMLRRLPDPRSNIRMLLKPALIL